MWTDLRGKLPGSETYARRELSEVRYLVIHHSGVDVDSSALQIAEWHVLAPEAGLFWPGIGYHYLVHWDGSIDYVGDLTTVRYNVAGRNRECVGICLPGDFNKRPPAAAQLAGTRRLILYLVTIFPTAQVVGHGDIALPGHETSCCGQTRRQWLPDLA